MSSSNAPRDLTRAERRAWSHGQRPARGRFPVKSSTSVEFRPLTRAEGRRVRATVQAAGGPGFGRPALHRLPGATPAVDAPVGEGSES